MAAPKQGAGEAKTDQCLPVLLHIFFQVLVQMVEVHAFHGITNSSMLICHLSYQASVDVVLSHCPLKKPSKAWCKLLITDLHLLCNQVDGIQGLSMTQHCKKIRVLGTEKTEKEIFRTGKRETHPAQSPCARFQSVVSLDV